MTVKHDVHAAALVIFIVLFLFVTVVGFLASRWRRGDLAHINEWGLGGRQFGTWVTWFLVGGDIYTAYTFIAVPAAMYGLGSKSAHPLDFLGIKLTMYAAFFALLANFVVAIVLTPLLRAAESREPADETAPEDYIDLSEAPLSDASGAREAELVPG